MSWTCTFSICLWFDTHLINWIFILTHAQFLVYEWHLNLLFEIMKISIPKLNIKIWPDAFTSRMLSMKLVWPLTNMNNQFQDKIKMCMLIIWSRRGEGITNWTWVWIYPYQLHIISFIMFCLCSVQYSAWKLETRWVKRKVEKSNLIDWKAF